MTHSAPSVPTVDAQGPLCGEIVAGAMRGRAGLLGVHAELPEGVSLHYDASVLPEAAVAGIADDVSTALGRRWESCRLRLVAAACEPCATTLEAAAPPGASNPAGSIVSHGRSVAGQPPVYLSVANTAAARLPGLVHRPLPRAHGAATAQTTAQVAAQVAAASVGARSAADTAPGAHAHHAMPVAAEAAEETQIAPLAWATVICLTGLAVGWLGQRFAVPAGWLPSVAPLLLYVVSYVAGGYHRVIDGWTALRAGRLDINFLMLAGAVGAAVLGEWQEGATLMFLFSLSNTLEAFAIGRTRRAIRALMHLTPQEATVRRGGEELRVRVEQLVPGDTVLVKPGERIPVDGTITQGQSAVDQAPITGESTPVEKQPGEAVFAGTINGQGHLEIAVTRAAGDTTLARIIRIVQQAEAQKAQTERMTDWIDRYYTLIVIGGTITVLLALRYLAGWTWSDAFYRSMLVLVVASPCALVISTPAAILSAIAAGARQGVLFKGGAHLEALGNVSAIAFDKTGTLTEGQPKVTDVMPIGAYTGEELLRLAAAVERRSEHPLARAVVDAAEAGGIDAADAEDVQALPGFGVEGRVDGRSVRAGRKPDPRRDGPQAATLLCPGVQVRVEALESEGKTVMLVWASGDGHAAAADASGDGAASAMDGMPLVGIIAVADTVRPEARATVAALRRLGIRRTVMLTGDNEQVARSIAAQLGIDEVRAELLPEDKVTAIQALRREYGRVAMVGDGVNDAPALASAEVGIAMGGGGTDVALETSDVVLMKDDLRKLPVALDLGRRARRVVAQNLAFSTLVIVALLIAAFTVDLTLPLGVLGHEGSTILVALNGLRLLRPSQLILSRI